MKASRPLLSTFLLAPGAALAQAELVSHEPNYLLGVLILAAIAASISIGERRFLKNSLRTFGQLLIIGVASVVLVACARSLDLAIGARPLVVLLVLATVIVLVPKAIKRHRRGVKPDA